MEAFHFVLNLRQSKQITDYYTQVLLRLSKLVPLQRAASTPHRNISTVQLHQKCRNKLFITFINMRTADHHRGQRNQLPVSSNIEHCIAIALLLCNKFYFDVSPSSPPRHKMGCWPRPSCDDGEQCAINIDCGHVSLNFDLPDTAKFELCSAPMWVVSWILRYYEQLVI